MKLMGFREAVLVLHVLLVESDYFCAEVLFVLVEDGDVRRDLFTGGPLDGGQG
jgi:hypothetical protein